MANISRCDGCGQESKGGQQWLRVRIEPYYPKGQAYSRFGEDGPVAEYSEGMVVDACGPQCAALALSIQAGVISGTYENMAESLLRVKRKIEADGNP
jgi:hypothetical protein